MNNNPNILVVAGEASGDRHAARLVRALRRRIPGMGFWGIGGELLRAEGFEALVDASQMNVVGFVEVLKRYRFFRSVLERVVEQARARRPELAILVDYPGFNLRLARRLRREGVRVVYYIAPQVWAWKEGRVRALRDSVDDLIVVFPFEVEYFARHGIEAHFFGHPLIDQASEREPGASPAHSDGPPTIAYLPGSRPEEIARHMPIVVEVMRRIGPVYRHVIPLATTIPRALLDAYAEPGLFQVTGSAHEALAGARAALVKSGTSTLDATLLGIPMAAFYRTSAVSYQIARRLITLPHIAMPNVLAGRRVVGEFVQDAMTPDALTAELQRLLADGAERDRMVAELAAIRAALGDAGSAERIAEYIVGRYVPHLVRERGDVPSPDGAPSPDRSEGGAT